MGQYQFDQIVERNNTNCDKWDDCEEEFGRKDLIPLWIADMDFQSPPEVIQAIIDRAEHGIYGYTIRTVEYYRSVANWVKKRHGWDVSIDSICPAPGVVPTLAISILSFTKPGDKILVQSPVYAPFFNMVEENNRGLITNPLIYHNGIFDIDFDDFEKKIKDPEVKMFILCNPHNPVGRVWTKQELLKMGNLCLQYGVMIVSDEIHSDIVYSGNKHIPIASLSPDLASISLTCLAPSKTFNIAGLKTSMVIVEDIAKKKSFLSREHAMNLQNNNVFGIEASLAAYTYGDRWLTELIQYLEGNISFVDQFFKSRVPEIKLVFPEGTYIPFIDCKELGLNSKDLQSFFVNQAGVAMNNGRDFGIEGEGFMRMNIAAPRGIIQSALERMEKAVFSR